MAEERKTKAKQKPPKTATQLIQRISNDEYKLRRIDKGGAGDCCFRVFAYILNKRNWLLPKSEWRAEQFTVESLRGDVADYVRGMDKFTFEAVFDTFKLWNEDWVDELQENLESSEMDWSDVQEAAAENISESGNNHWGTEFDIAVLTNKYDLAATIITDQPRILCYGGVNDATWHFLLFNVEGYHYQLAALIKNKDPDKGKKYELLHCTELPLFLQDWHEDQCKHALTCKRHR